MSCDLGTRHRRDERTLINPPTSSIALPLDDDEDDDVDDWRASV